MADTRTPRLWVNDNGALTCEACAGSYLRSAIAARPRAKRHQTPLGTWEVVDLPALTAEFASVGLPAPACETC